MKINLGCGHSILPGWTNLDSDPQPGAIRCDLSKPLPYADGSVDLVYSEHFIEHLTAAQGLSLFLECHRVLRSGGAVRFSTPCLRALAKAYLASKLETYKDVGWLPKSPAEMMNDGMRAWGHLFLYDEQELKFRLEAAGFKNVQKKRPRRSMIVEFRNLEGRPDLGDLVVEAVKP